MEQRRTHTRFASCFAFDALSTKVAASPMEDTMRHLILLLIFAFALTGITSNAVAQDSDASEVSAEEYAKRIQAFYKKTEDFQAKFTQTYQDIAAGTSKVSYGRVYFKKPGKMRWDYYTSKSSKKRDKIYVSDGNAFWIYETEFKQVFRQCLSKSQLPTSLRFLMGEGELLEEFDVTLAGTHSKESPALKLVPKVATSKYKELRFEIDPETYQVQKTVVFDPYGNSNSIQFNNTLVNRKLPDSGFDFKAPADARVVNPQQKCD